VGFITNFLNKFFTLSYISLANSEANRKRIQYIEQCFGNSGEVSIEFPLFISSQMFFVKYGKKANLFTHLFYVLLG